MKTVIAAVVLSLCSQVFAATHVQGDLTMAVLDPSGNPYLADQDVIVPAGKTVTIKAGCVLLFKNFTGLRVDGTLVVEGVSGKPVVFTSGNDADYNPGAEQLPNSFDWNGITVSRESRASLKNFVLRYSVYGIKSQNPEIALENGLFNQNGQFHFTINDKVQDVKDNVPFSFNSTPPATVTGAKKTVDAPAGTGTKKPSVGRKILRYACLGIGLAGAGVGVAYGIQTGGDLRKLNDLSATRPLDGGAQWNTASNRLTGDRALAIVSGSLCPLGLIGFGITFAF